MQQRLGLLPGSPRQVIGDLICGPIIIPAPTRSEWLVKQFSAIDRLIMIWSSAHFCIRSRMWRLLQDLSSGVVSSGGSNWLAMRPCGFGRVAG